MKGYDIRNVDLNLKLETIACASNYGRIILLDYMTLKIKQVLNGHEPISETNFQNQVIFVSFSPDGRWLASYGQDERLIVWDTKKWIPVQDTTIESLRGIVSIGIVWSPDSRRILTLSSRSLDIWAISSSGEETSSPSV